ncbi:MAG: F0F1 ATP synthase subunit gamma [Candidatus Omnitrophica bacterium]|nr:F0F1 ATP synthase subunit gamma [Candidatus Omnitrophota bacterium]
MIPLLKLKKDVQFNQELIHVVDVLKGIAAARFHVLERRLAVFEQYFNVASELLTVIDFARLGHPFVQPRTPVTGVVMVTSDAGFLGGLNAQVVNLGLEEGGPTALLTVIGERGTYYLRDTRQSVSAFPGIQDDERNRLALAGAVRDHVVRQVLGGSCGRVIVVYPKPVSFTVQEITMETLIPCSTWVAQRAGQPRAVPNLLWESRMDEVMEYVLLQWMGRRLDEIFALSRLAELAARAVHLEGSYQELLRRGKKLKLQYFRARHEVIDRSIREVCAAQLLYGQTHGD